MGDTVEQRLSPLLQQYGPVREGLGPVVCFSAPLSVGVAEVRVTDIGANT